MRPSEAISNKCISSSNKCIATRNKKLLVTILSRPISAPWWLTAHHVRTVLTMTTQRLGRFFMRMDSMCFVGFVFLLSAESGKQHDSTHITKCRYSCGCQVVKVLLASLNLDAAQKAALAEYNHNQQMIENPSTSKHPVVLAIGSGGFYPLWRIVKFCCKQHSFHLGFSTMPISINCIFCGCQRGQFPRNLICRFDSRRLAWPGLDEFALRIGRCNDASSLRHVANDPLGLWLGRWHWRQVAIKAGSGSIVRHWWDMAIKCLRPSLVGWRCLYIWFDLQAPTSASPRSTPWMCGRSMMPRTFTFLCEEVWSPPCPEEIASEVFPLERAVTPFSEYKLRLGIVAWLQDGSLVKS